MKQRLVAALTAGAMSAVTAMLYVGAIVPRPAAVVALPIWWFPLAGLVAFAGVFCASYVVVRTPVFRVGHAITLVLLSDLFAAMTYLLIMGAIVPTLLYHFDGMTEADRGNLAIIHWFEVPAFFVLLLIGAMTVGNWVTRGVGIFMTIPSILWLMRRSRRSALGPQ